MSNELSFEPSEGAMRRTLLNLQACAEVSPPKPGEGLAQWVERVSVLLLEEEVREIRIQWPRSMSGPRSMSMEAAQWLKLALPLARQTS